MSKTRAILTGYLVGAWLTFGYTSTLWGERLAGAPNKLAEWDAVYSLIVAIFWPIYWFCKTGMMVFGG